MPLLQEVGCSGRKSPDKSAVEEKINVDDDDVDDTEKVEDNEDEEMLPASSSSSSTRRKKERDGSHEETTRRKKAKLNEEDDEDDDDKQERTFLTFSDFDTFRGTFPRRKPRTPQQKICPITRLPAKYFDPVTRLPYANLQAFRFIREAYYSQLETKGDKDDPEVAAWIEWRQKNKPMNKTSLMNQVQRPPMAFQHLLAGGTGSVSSGASASTASQGPPTPNLSGGATRASSSSAGSVSVPASPSHHHPSLAGGGQGLSALASAVRSGTVLPTAASPGVQQQSVVLPVRTTPLPQTPISSSALIPSAVSQLINNQNNSHVAATATGASPVVSASSNVSHAIVTAALPTQPVANVSAVAAAAAAAGAGGVHTVKIGGPGGGQQVRVRTTNT